jgi:hypothetical protein
MPLIIHTKGGVEEVDDNQEDKQQQPVEGDQVVAPRDAGLSQPVPQAEYLGAVLDILQR